MAAGALQPFDIKDPKSWGPAYGSWINQQPATAQVLATTMLGGLQGGVMGRVMGQFTSMNSDQMQSIQGNNPDIAKQMMMMQQGGPWGAARSFAVITGVNQGVTLAMKKLQGKENVRGALVAGFFSGFAFSAVSTPGAAEGLPKKLIACFNSGVLFALAQGAFYQLGQRGPKADAPEYARARYLLANLGLSKYDKNLQKAMLADNTIMLWNHEALRDAKIPPGPRLLIMHHLEQFQHVLKPGMPVPKQLPFGPPSPAEGMPATGQQQPQQGAAPLQPIPRRR